MAEEIERLNRVMQRTGRKKTSIYTDPTFPPRVRLGARAVGWRRSDIDRWIESRKEVTRQEEVKVAS